jgi:hypothetical protein
VQESQNYFDDLSEIPSQEQLTQWETEISKAEAARTNKPEVMDVMGPKIPKGRLVVSSSHPTHISLAAPSLAEKRLQLLQTPERGVAGETAWLLAGLKLEEQQ